MSRQWICFLVSGGVHIVVILLGGSLLICSAEYGVDRGESGIPGEMQIQIEEDSLFDRKCDEAEVEVKESTVMEPEFQEKPKSPARKAKQESGSSGAQAEVRPNYLKNRPPPYPEESKRKGETGLVLLAVEVSVEGDVTGVRVERSSGFARLDEAAAKGVRDWRFFPAKFNGIPVASCARVPVRFKLE